MFKILFICHGNICRSPAAEIYMKSLVKEKGKEDEYIISSAGISDEEEGNPVHRGQAAVLAREGLDYKYKRARQVTKEDGEYYDYLICMDRYNLSRLKSRVGEKNAAKGSLLLKYCNEQKDVFDPWYTGDFEGAFSSIKRGCDALFKYLENKKTN